MAESQDELALFYHYNPSLIAAAIFAALYGIAFVLTVVQWVRFRPRVWLVMVAAAGMEVVGYITRCLSTWNVTEKSIYVLQFALLVLAPVLMAGVCYVLFGRILFLAVPKEHRTLRVCWVPPRFVTQVFVGFDILALLLQLAGVVFITSGNGESKDAIDQFNRGRDLAIGGVALQLVAFGIFTVAAIRFNFTSKKFIQSAPEQLEAQTDLAFSVENKPTEASWPSLLRVVNLTTLMILIRSVYRLVEFTETQLGYINTHEWCMYVFDAVPIYPCVALFIYWHPSLYLPYMGFRLPKHAR
ncbi:hypothetical protein P175DRAFT_0426608 [Aspergillus ochraceoroseus IBT 24754]|uniref:RTA1 domain protein n=3 Tax=Aspergillus subgen. Nidulantes TaxID=2720870 RepID=A0A0F8USQ5_9EURO|nr:uncharacterized protein P175DRAFT_0426608 [Aspergillus ochraceoroseus IBT 24754]KKK16093.1 hypothetical protein AOCH_005596 [Aspergillus ochraceoroseus]KKK22619.1 hypothetical protein ARAM_005514 [Aspergillus rambellii]PTU25152.1 hypothetical protein P175DRAFT_0426608 [Aspergillus ochraceoroseus IBT 24754]